MQGKRFVVTYHVVGAANAANSYDTFEEARAGAEAVFTGEGRQEIRDTETKKRWWRADAVDWHPSLDAS